MIMNSRKPNKEAGFGGLSSGLEKFLRIFSSARNIPGAWIVYGAEGTERTAAGQDITTGIAVRSGRARHAGSRADSRTSRS